MDKNMIFALCIIAFAGIIHGSAALLEESQSHGGTNVSASFSANHSENESEQRERNEDGEYINFTFSGEKEDNSSEIRSNSSDGGNNSGEGGQGGENEFRNGTGQESGNGDGGAEISNDEAPSTALSRCGIDANESAEAAGAFQDSDSDFRQGVIFLLNNGSEEEKGEFCDNFRSNIESRNNSNGSGLEGREILGAGNGSSGNATYAMASRVAIVRRANTADVMGMLMRGMNALEIIQALGSQRLAATGTISVGNETFMLLNGWITGNSMQADIYTASLNGSMSKAGEAELEIGNETASGIVHIRGKDVAVR